MKVWVNSSEAANVTDGYVTLHYVEEPALENEILGYVIQHPGKNAVWICGNGVGEVPTVEEAQKMVEDRINGILFIGFPEA